MKYICPVCGYDELPSPPVSFQICPSCGTEFENDDMVYTVPELRVNWISEGMRWWSPNIPAPANWNPVDQLRKVIMNNVGTEKRNTFKKLNLTGQLIQLIPQALPENIVLGNQYSIVEFHSNSKETLGIVAISGQV